MLKNNLIQEIEALLFVAGDDVSTKNLAAHCHISVGQVEDVVHALEKKYNNESGVVMIRSGAHLRLATNPAIAESVGKYMHANVEGELTRPQLETLTIIAYRAPISKHEIELIRGVNCTLILRNLMMRGFVEEEHDALETTYRATTEFLRFLGLRATKELPEFDALSSKELIDQLQRLEDERALRQMPNEQI